MNLDRLLYYENIRRQSKCSYVPQWSWRRKPGQEKSRRAGMSLFIMRCRGGFWGAVTTADTEGTYWDGYIYRLGGGKRESVQPQRGKGRDGRNH